MSIKGMLMSKYKELYGGSYERIDGRWYWRMTESSDLVLVTSGMLNVKIREAKNKVLDVVKIEPKVEVKQETVLEEKPVQVAKKPAPKKKKEETPKDEPKATEEAQ